MHHLANIIAYLALIGLIQCKVVINSTTLSTVRSSVGAIQAGNKIFFAGGFEYHDYVPSSAIDVYNLDDNDWEPPMALQHPRANLNPVVLGQHVYFIGGNEYTNKPFVYNSAVGDFRRPTLDPPTVRTISEISFHNSILTVIGKWNVNFYNVTSDTWNTSDSLRDIMESLVGPIVFAAENYVFIVGGRNSTDQISNLFYVYNVDTNTLIQRSTTLEVAKFSGDTSKISPLLYNFNNNVLAVNKNTTTLLYHVIEDQIAHVNFGQMIFMTSISNMTYLFPRTRNGIGKYRWANNTQGYSSSLTSFVYAFGDDEFVGYVGQDSLGYANINIFGPSGETTMFVSKPALDNMDWIASVTGYSWPPNKYVFADKNTVLVVNLGTIVQANFTIAEIRKIFVTANDVYVFSESSTDECLHVISTTFVRTIFECMDVPDLVVGDKFVYLAQGISRQWPNKDIIVATFEPIKTSELLTEQTLDDQLFMIKPTPQIVPSGIIEVLNYTSPNATWSDPILMPQELTGQNNIVATTVNDTVLALFDAFRLEIHSPEDFQLLQGAGYNVTGNTFDYPVHSQVAAVVGNDVYMKTLYNSQYLVIYNNETGWRTTKPFPDIATIEPKQLFTYNNKVIYMIAQDNPPPGEIGSFGRVYLYDVDSQIWQITQHPTQTSVTAAMIGDFLALFASDGKMYSLHIPTGVWLDENISNTHSFSSVVHVPSKGLTFVSGAESLVDGQYSNRVLVLTDDGVIPVVPQGLNTTRPDVPESAQDNTTLIVAIVVPVGAAVIAGGLLAFFLVRRKNQKRKRDGATSVIGLETKYGQWFTPFDQIKFGEQLGQGGNGQVFKGTWKNSTVALKVSMTQANSTVIGELELMMQMRPHPNVVQLFGFSIHPETDSIILIIEYCDQGSLDSTLFEANRPITIEEKVKWIASAANGLSHLHSNNIVHRDVAARNILLHQNEPKITDFGMSRLVDEENTKGTTKSELGPIRWMAPEALKSKEYSTKSDVWSFGVLMYEIIAQQEPHSDADPIEVGRLIRDSGLTPVIPESCPTNLATIMKQCWNMNAQQRPTIDQILRQLEDN